MNRVMNNEYQMPLKFNTQEDILEAHQIMINQLRENIIKLANKVAEQDELLLGLFGKIELEKQKIEKKLTANESE